MEVDSSPDVASQPLPRQHPLQLVPGSPVLSFDSLVGGKNNNPSILDTNNIVYLTSGRMAIAQALLLNNIGPGDEVLVPAYHCSSMIAPIEYSGAKPVFYKIQKNMSVDMKDINKKLSSKTRLLLVAHYFGFPQPIKEIKRFCTEKNILLLEDCAHALFTEVENRPLGSFGDYAAGSLMKFFPVNDGGFLVASENNLLSINTLPGGKGFELRTILNTLEKSFMYNRLKALNLILKLPLTLKNLIWKRLKSKNSISAINALPAASDGGFGFEPKWINTRISWFSKLICKLTSTSKIIDRRKKNYNILQSAFKDTSECYPLFPNLHDGVVPYVFPIIVENVDPAFKNLRALGVPLLRWEYLHDEVNNMVCSTSHYYSRHLIQIPCHQELEEGEIRWMAENIKSELMQYHL